MENAKQKIEGIKQQQRKRFQENSQARTESSPVRDRPQYIIAFWGIAAGLIIATIIWLMMPILTTGYTNTISPESAEAIQASDIKKTNDNIAHLNKRMESLTDTNSKLEAKLMRDMVLTNSITNIENKHASSSQKFIPESAYAEPTSNIKEPNTSRIVHMETKIEKAFVPTHTVKARVNLRPSSSLNTTPIAILKAGSGVEYIREEDGWYYVNTQFNWKGWCSSDYLSPLLPTQQNASSN